MKNGKLKKLITLATVVASTFALVACGSSSSDDSKGSDSSAKKDSETVYRTLDEIKKDGTINIGVFSDKNPFGYVDENGEYQGYDVYFANRIGEDLGVKVNFVSTEAANRIEYLQTGKVDLILANFTVTDERAEEVDFALPYMNVALGVVSPDSNIIKSLDNWNSKDQMIVISGTTAETYLTENYPDSHINETSFLPVDVIQRSRIGTGRLQRGLRRAYTIVHIDYHHIVEFQTFDSMHGGDANSLPLPVFCIPIKPVHAIRQAVIKRLIPLVDAVATSCHHTHITRIHTPAVGLIAGRVFRRAAQSINPFPNGIHLI